ncbi:MAG TPA: transposase [Chloroflexota bacterium]|jgi:hypothetical protein
MSFRAKRELLVQVAPRYREATHKQKSVVLDEFLAATGYARKYAIRLLAKPIAPPAPIQRPRAPRYGPAVCEALRVAWTATNEICSKRLVPFLPELVPALERHGHLELAPDVRTLLLALSPATADRLLRPLRQPHGISTTRRGRLLKQQIPVRTFADWSDVRPGFLEADLVAHCGGVAEGAFLYTLTLTDIATTWTECLPLLHRTQEAVLQAVERARLLLPFPLLGFDTDNGSEFLNEQLFAYCEREQITFTRGRTANKNDQCYVEQKNGSVVRQLVGYDRFEGERTYRQLAELYRAVRLYVNFFQPSFKLLTKQRTGGHVRRTYGPAQTPFQRLLASDVLTPETRDRLTAIYQALDPVRLLRQIRLLQDALWRQAVFGRAGRPRADATASTTEGIRFDGRACGLAGASAVEPESGPPVPAHDGRTRRRYRKPLGPRTWRTRADPFAEVWDELAAALTARPERTAKELLRELQARYPGQYADSVLRTLQHRVRAWRASAILTFDSE